MCKIMSEECDFNKGQVIIEDGDDGNTFQVFRSILYLWICD